MTNICFLDFCKFLDSLKELTCCFTIISTDYCHYDVKWLKPNIVGNSFQPVSLDYVKRVVHSSIDTGLACFVLYWDESIIFKIEE